MRLTCYDICGNFDIWVWSSPLCQGRGNFDICELYIPPPRAGESLHFEPEKKVSDAYFGQRLLEYDFLQIPRGKTITSSFEHAVSDTFNLIISERAPLEMTHISMSPKVICEGAKRPSGGRVWEGGGAGKFLHLEPEKNSF